MKKTRKRYKLKKSVKETIAIIILLSVAIGGLVKVYQKEQQAYEKARQEEQQAYANCIREQDKKDGYIIRSACSNNWQELDARTHAKYKQIKKDLYLISID